MSNVLNEKIIGSKQMHLLENGKATKQSIIIG